MSYYHKCISQKQERSMALTGKAMPEEAPMYFGQKKKKNFCISFKEVAQIIPVKEKEKKKKKKEKPNINSTNQQFVLPSGKEKL